MARFFLHIEYDGAGYHGWQIQDNAHSVQEELQKALSTIMRSPVEIMGSGRTDTGVHASAQVVHADLPETTDPEDLVYKLNSLLPGDIAVHNARPVKEEAHARFDATSRGYEYYIHQRKSAFKAAGSYYFPRTLDLEQMNLAASRLIGTQDFQSFSKVKTEVNNFICSITEARWEKSNENLVFHVTANRFLRGMVRALVGTLLEVGLGKLSVDDFVKIIESKDRRNAGRAVPPNGLFLSQVSYPEAIYL